MGETFGYRIKEVKSRLPLGRDYVEGVLTRMIQQDPELAGVAAIVFDEFHERIHGDFGLALSAGSTVRLHD